MTTTKKKKQQDIRGDQVTVLCVLKRNAKSAKQALEGIHALHKKYRMIPSVNFSDCIAVPIILPVLFDEEEKQQGEDIRSTSEGEPSPENFAHAVVEEWKQTYEWDWIRHVDRQLCPYSTAVMGNQHHLNASNNSQGQFSDGLGQQDSNAGGALVEGLTSGQQALYHVIRYLAQEEREQQSKQQQGNNDISLKKDIQSLDMTICPKKLEVFGDDRTVVLPPTAFPISTVDQLLEAHVLQSIKVADDTNNESSSSCLKRLRQDFWKQLAAFYKSQRIARRGKVDPESKIRESGHRLIWPNSQGIPDETGPGAPGWIRVTEQGIGQSFDMCRVMFSRGNISEKIRFGKLVQPGERLLDMYAGIGYYTLPALVIGKAAHVVACEWNEHAIRALKFNVKDNKISEDRVTILKGDCRVVCQEHGLVNQFDRISLGLLPSAEGGWRTAIKALGPNGGWLHIHANVPVAEVNDWSLWMSRELWNLVQEERSSDEVNEQYIGNNEEDASGNKWIVVCHYVEKVKSFAPTVAHFVADVYVGRPSGLNSSSASCQDIDPSCTTAVVVQTDGTLIHCPETVKPPSCALSPDGVLSQEWMR
ncbi:unnamed protein product [Cylindrotheca closterium]|uniref:SAM-dependent methyltransferase TRM5/TYW2-type domain-containing protein n=1 Tax=Cylindrotheca closterium TaxID=2856 RepID=A0AAD2JNA6_9STRA|nr:unnamed protein product [Cylindrotheca closterium]